MLLGRVATVAATLLLAFVAACATRFSVRVWRRDRWMRRHVPMVKPASVLGGSVDTIRRTDRHRRVQDWGRQHGLVFGYRWLWMHTLVVSEPALVAQLLSRGGWAKQGLDKPVAELYGRLNLVISEGGRTGGLFTLPTGPHHRAVRRALAPAFAADNLKRGFPAILEITAQLVAALTAAGPNTAVNVDEALMRQAFDVLGRVGFGADFGATRSLTQRNGMCAIFDSLVGAIAEGVARITDPFRELQRFWRQDVRDGMQFCKAFRTFNLQLARRLRKQEPPPETVAAHLLHVQDPETGRPLSDERLAAELGILMIAGVDTTSHTMAFLLYHVSQHPDVEAKVVQELAEAGLLATPQQPQPRALQLSDLQLPYLACVIKESMRLLPVAGEGTFRVSSRKVQLGDLTVPAGVFIWANSLNTFTDEALWDRANDFLPERWLEPDADYANASSGGSQPSADSKQQQAAAAVPTQRRQLRQRTAGSSSEPKTRGSLDGADTAAHADGAEQRPRRYFPFGQGQRGCIGRGLAVMNYTAAAAVLLGHFTFRLADQMGGPEGVAAAEYGNLTIQTRGGLRMHCVPRTRVHA